MYKIYTFLFLFLLSFSSFSQRKITVNGRVLEKHTQVPLVAATVYLSAVMDSVVIDYTISDKNGFFTFDTKKITKPVYLKISYLGYQAFKQQVNTITNSKDFGDLYMSIDSNNLAEVVVKSEVPPIRIKKDTLEFNASSFKVRPDANVETLLKQLPGVVIAVNGKISVNGKEVNQVLVNGKPFFDKDGKIAIQSLPSDIIEKVQITDSKTKKEELTQQASSSNNASINLTIDEKKNRGIQGKFMGGYGTNDRYESSALVNYFKNKRKISFLGSSNNINATGFSMDDVFDNMGGGRNASSGSFSSGRGIVRSNMLGMNYSDDWLKDFESNGSYFFSNSNSENANRSVLTTFLPTGNFTTRSNAKTNEENRRHNFNFQLEYKVDSTSSIVVAPKFVKSNTNSTNDSFEQSSDETNQLLNENTSQITDDRDNTNLANSISYNKSFKRKGRFLSVSFKNENSKEEGTSLNKTNTVFYQGNDPDIIRNQIRENKNRIDNYTTEIEWGEPVADSLRVKFGMDYSSRGRSEDKSTYDFNPISQSYSELNPNLTTYFTSTENTFRPKVGFSIEKEKFNVTVNAGPSITQFDNYALYLGKTTDLNKNYILPYGNAQISYRFSKSKSIWSSYNYQVTFPSASQILPVKNLANPLNTIEGNPNLIPSKSHSAYFSFRDYNFANRSGYSIYFGGNWYDSQIVSATVYDANRTRSTSYENISGTYSSWFGGNWNKSVKKEVHNFRFDFDFNANYGLTKGFTDQEIFEANYFNVTPSANFTYEYGELLTINPSYSFTYNETKYTNYLLSSTSNLSHRFNIQTTSYWPKNWYFGNDFGYIYNSTIADGFKKDFYLWNTSLAYQFFNKKMTAKIKVYDLLNQNQSVTRSISSTSIRDEEYLVLKRYLMFSLTYKIKNNTGN
jgi:hypothetical protein